MNDKTSAVGTPGFWQRSLGAEVPRPRLCGDQAADVAIVGAGFTGLWTAYFVQRLRPDLRILVIEANSVGFGASGRNGGWISPLFPGNRRRLASASAYGLAGVRAQQRALIEAVDELLEILAHEGIDADQHRGGMLSAARCPAALDRLRSQRTEDLVFGYSPAEVQLLRGHEFAERIAVDRVGGGLCYPGVARVNPARLVRQLASLVEQRGTVIFERSAVTKIAGGRLFLERGTVCAPITLICTEGYSASLLGNRRLVPINSSMFVTHRLPPAVWEHIGWFDVQCLNDAAHRFVYAQRTADDRIAIGGRGIPYRFGSRIDGTGDTSPRTVLELEQRLRSFFPGVPFEVDEAWSGVLGVARDWNAAVTWDPSVQVGSSVGYAGHGLTASFLGGRTLAELALGRATQRTQLPWVGHRFRGWEPEPLRWLGINLTYKLFGMADDWEEYFHPPRTAWAARLGRRVAGLS